MKASQLTKFIPALAALSALSVVVACGKNGDNRNASIKEIRQEEVIVQSYKSAQPDYDPSEKINIALASRLRGATLEVVKRDEKSAESEAAIEVKFGAILAKPEIEIKAKGVLREGMLQILETDGEAGLPEGYGVAATCLKTSNCSRVMVFIAHTDSVADLAAGSMTSDELELNLAGGSISAGTNSSDETEKAPEVPKLNAPMKPSRVAMLFVRQQASGAIKLVWSASSSMGGDRFLKGGTQKSVAEAKQELSGLPTKDNGPVSSPSATSAAPDATAASEAPAAPAVSEAPVASEAPATVTPDVAADAAEAQK